MPSPRCLCVFRRSCTAITRQKPYVTRGASRPSSTPTKATGTWWAIISQRFSSRCNHVSGHGLRQTDPRTNLANDARRFDFFSHVPEATRTLTELYSNAGIPASYREMNGNSVHAYKFVNAGNQTHYVKFHWKSLQGVRNLAPNEALKRQGADYSHLTQDLVAHIDKGNFPSGMVCAGTRARGAEALRLDPLDATKVWPDVPFRKTGQLVRNRNPPNVPGNRAVAMAPSNLIPGIEPSRSSIAGAPVCVCRYADVSLGRHACNCRSWLRKSPVNNANQEGSHDSASTTTGIITSRAVVCAAEVEQRSL